MLYNLYYFLILLIAFTIVLSCRTNVFISIIQFMFYSCLVLFLIMSFNPTFVIIFQIIVFNLLLLLIFFNFISFNFFISSFSSTHSLSFNYLFQFTIILAFSICTSIQYYTLLHSLLFYLEFILLIYFFSISHLVCLIFYHFSSFNSPLLKILLFILYYFYCFYFLTLLLNYLILILLCLFNCFLSN